MADTLVQAEAASSPRAGAATRVAKNTVAQLAAMASTIVSKLLITIVIARMFGPNEVGDFSFVVTFAMLFTFMSTAGLSWSLIRETATHRDAVDRYASNGLSLAMLSGLVTVPLMVGIVSVMGYPVHIRLAVALVGVAMVFESLGQVINGIFGGLERMELGAYILFAQETVFLLIGGTVLLLRVPFLWLFAVYVPSRLTGFLAGWWLYRRVLGRTLWPRLEWTFIKDLLRTSLPYAINMALGPIYLRIDVVMLSFYQGSEALGFYEAATTIFYRLNVFARTFNNALLPLMASEFEAVASRVRRYVRAAVKYQLISGVPLTVACMMLADRLILLIYGSAFASSIIVFRLLTAIVCLQFIDHTLATALTAIGLQSRRSAAVALAAVSNVFINLYFIPAHSFVGATVSTILTEVIFFSALYFMLSRQPRHRSGPKASRLLARQLFLKPGLAGLVMAAVLWVLRGWHLVLLGMAGGIVYLGMLLILGVFTPAELRFFLRVSRIYRVMPARMRGAIMCTADVSTSLEGTK